MGQNGHLSLEWATKYDCLSVGSLPLAIDILNSLVMALLCDVDLSILADIPSGPFNLVTSSEPNINSTSSVEGGMMGIMKNQFQEGRHE